MLLALSTAEHFESSDRKLRLQHIMKIACKPSIDCAQPYTQIGPTQKILSPRMTVAVDLEPGATIAEHLIDGVGEIGTVLDILSKLLTDRIRI